MKYYGKFIDDLEICLKRKDVNIFFLSYLRFFELGQYRNLNVLFFSSWKANIKFLNSLLHIKLDLVYDSKMILNFPCHFLICKAIGSQVEQLIQYTFSK